MVKSKGKVNTKTKTKKEMFIEQYDNYAKKGAPEKEKTNVLYSFFEIILYIILALQLMCTAYLLLNNNTPHHGSYCSQSYQCTTCKGGMCECKYLDKDNIERTIYCPYVGGAK